MTAVQENFGSASGEITVTTERRGTEIARLRELGRAVDIGMKSNPYRTELLIRQPCSKGECQAAVFRRAGYENVRECHNCHSAQTPDT